MTPSTSAPNSNGTSTDTNTDTDGGGGRRQQQRNELQQLREQIQDAIHYVDDVDLKRELRQWVADSYSIPAGSIEGHVEHRISEMEAEYRMHDHDDVRRGSEAFPDACQGCPSYGGGCPIVTHPTPQQELERIAAETSDGTQYKLETRRLARDYTCHRLPEFITEFEDVYAEKIEAGHELLASVDVEIYDSVTDEPTHRVDVQFDEDDEFERGGG